MHSDHKNAGAAARHHRKAGLTLLELLVVLMVLIAVAGIIVPNVTELGIGGKTPQEIVTEQTLIRVRDAILGTPSQPGMWTDLGQRETLFPQTIAELFVLPTDLIDPPHRTPLPDSLKVFAPNTRLGWHGPYLQFSGAHYLVDTTKNFILDYGYGPQPNDPNADPAVLDGWGHPIVIQFPTVPEPDRSLYVRLVSAGENGAIDTPLNDLTTTNPAMPAQLNCVDDIVLFLRAADARPHP